MKIKGFDEDLKCRGYQFEIGKTYEIKLPDGYELTKEDLCSDKVFHYCDSLRNVHGYYSVNPDDHNRFCEIEVLGDEVTGGNKCGSNKIKIIREIVGEELDILRGLIKGNTGLFNSGYCNSGNFNIGNPYGEFNWGWNLMYIGEKTKVDTDILLWTEMEETGAYCEVIGNVYDNPELLQRSDEE